MLSFSSQRRAWVSLGRRLLSTAGPVTEATAAATPDIPNFYTHAATRLPPPFWVLKKAAPTSTMEPDPTIDDVLSSTHPSGQDAFLDGVAKVFYSVAEVAFGAKVATVPPAPGASATPAVDPETATQDKFMSEVVHPDVQALLYSSKRTPAADRLVFNDILVKESFLVDHLSVFVFSTEESDVQLRAFYGPQQAYIVGRVPPGDLVRVAMLKGSVRLVAPTTLVRVSVLVRAEESSPEVEVVTGSAAPASDSGTSSEVPKIRVVRPHVLTFEAEFAPSDSYWAPVLKPTSGWRLVDFNHSTPTTTFNKTAEVCIKRELELQVMFDAATKEAEEEEAKERAEEEKEREEERKEEAREAAEEEKASGKGRGRGRTKGKDQ